MTSYTVETYIHYCKDITRCFKDMSILNGEKFTSFRVADLSEAKSDIPEGAVAILWIWSKYVTCDTTRWLSTSRHCYLDSMGYRINSGTYSQFEECADAWLASVRAKIYGEEIIFDEDIQLSISHELSISRPL